MHWSTRFLQYITKITNFYFVATATPQQKSDYTPEAAMIYLFFSFSFRSYNTPTSDKILENYNFRSKAHWNYHN